MRCGTSIFAPLLLLAVDLAAASAPRRLANATSLVGTGATLPADIYTTAAFAYSFVEPSVTVTYTGVGSGGGQSAIIGNRVDFAGSDSVLTAAQYNVTADLQMYPTIAAAVIAVVNLPEARNTTLYLARGTLADIFRGAIAWWNDSTIAATNPGVALPQQRIAVCVRLDRSGTTEVFTTALSKFSPAFASAIGVSSLPTWGFAVNAFSGTDGVAACVQGLLYSVGYMVLAEAQSKGLRFTGLVNRAGVNVLPDAVSLQYALMELGGRFDSRLNADITDAFSSGAWPISAYTYLVVRKTTTAPTSTCATRTALARFWQWFFTSPIVRDAASSLGFAVLPEFIRTQVVDKLLGDLRCSDGSLAFAAPQRTSIAGFGSGFARLALTFLLPAYVAASNGEAVDFVADDAGATVLSPLGRLLDHRHFVIHLATGDSALVSAPVDPVLGAPIATLPLFLASVAPVYNLPVNASFAVTNLVLDAPTLAAILAGTVSRWNDSAIAALNPGTPLPATQITVVVPARPSDATLILTSTLARLAPGAGTPDPPTPLDVWLGSSRTARYLSVDSDANVESGVLFTPGSIGYIPFTGSATRPVRLVRMIWPATGSGAGSTPRAPMLPSLAAATACADNSSLATSGAWFNVSASTNPACWPMTGSFAISVRGAYTPDDGTTACAFGLRAVSFARWLTTEDPSRSMQSVQLARAPVAVRGSVYDALGALTCGNNSIIASVVPCQPGQRRITASLCVACEARTYNLNGDGVCRSCPAGALCPGGSSLLAQAGYWQGAGETFYACETGACCPRGECTKTSAQERCGANRDPTSTLCAQCMPGSSPWARTCVRCDGPNVPFIVGVLAIGITFVAIIMHLPATSFPFFKLATDYIQLIVVLVLPSRLRLLRGFIQLFVLDVSALGDESWPCIWPLSPELYALFKIGWPLVLYGELLLLLVVEYVVRGIIHVRRAVAAHRHAARIRRASRHQAALAATAAPAPVAGSQTLSSTITVDMAPRLAHQPSSDDAVDVPPMSSVFLFKYLLGAWRLMMITYGNVVGAGLAYLNCMPVDDKRVLRDYHAVECGTSKYSALAAVCSALVAIAAVVIPLGIVFLLKRTMPPRYKYHGFAARVVAFVDFIEAHVVGCKPGQCCGPDAAKDAHTTIAAAKATVAVAPEDDATKPALRVSLPLSDGAGGASSPDSKRAPIGGGDTAATGEAPTLPPGLDHGPLASPARSHDDDGNEIAVVHRIVSRGSGGATARHEGDAALVPVSSRNERVTAPPRASLRHSATGGSRYDDGGVSGVPPSRGRRGSRGGASTEAPSFAQGAPLSPSAATSSRRRRPSLAAQSDAGVPAVIVTAHTHVASATSTTYMVGPAVTPSRLPPRHPAALAMAARSGKATVAGGKSRRRSSLVLPKLSRNATARNLFGQVGSWVSAPYRVWYESYFLSRRTLLLLLAVFISDRLVRAACLFMAAALFAFLQVTWHPFNKAVVNAMHTIMCFGVVAVAALEMMPVMAPPGTTDPPFLDPLVVTIVMAPIVPPILSMLPYTSALHRLLPGVIDRPIIPTSRQSEPSPGGRGSHPLPASGDPAPPAVSLIGFDLPKPAGHSSLPALPAPAATMPPSLPVAAWDGGGGQADASIAVASTDNPLSASPIAPA